MTSSRPILVIAGRHRPHEQLLLTYGALSGAVFLVGGAPEPASIAASMPGPVVTAWAAGLVASGVVGMVGCWWRGERGQILEAGGLLVGAGSLLLYSAALISAVGLRALFPAGVIAAWLCANLWRVAQIRRELRGGQAR
jgi:hypothetical protein